MAKQQPNEKTTSYTLLGITAVTSIIDSVSRSRISLFQLGIKSPNAAHAGITAYLKCPRDLAAAGVVPVVTIGPRIVDT
jgi:hypothetical protein